MEGILHVVATLVPSFVGALGATAFLNGFFMSVMGLLQPPPDLPSYIRWAHNVSFQTWPFRAMAQLDIGCCTFEEGSSGLEFLEARDLQVDVRLAVAIMAGMALFYRVVLFFLLVRL